VYLLINLTYQIIYLNLNNNNLQKLNNLIVTKNLNTLESLLLDSNNLTEIEAGYFKVFPSLKLLSLNNNKLKVIQKLAFNYMSLKYLYLQNNQIDRIETYAFYFSSIVSVLQSNGLVELYLDNNRLTLVTLDSFNGLRYLKVLNLNKNPIKQIEIDFINSGLFGSLEQFSVDTDSSELINVTCQFKSNQNINILTNKTFENMSNLIFIKLAYNQISHIQRDTFKMLKNLTKLYLNNNNLKQINDYYLEKLISLKLVELSYNRISFIESNAFFDLTNLEKIYLNYNQLKYLDVTLFGYNNLQLKLIQISNNNLETLEVYRLNRIESLSLRMNKLKIVRDFTFVSYSNLTRLDLSLNELIQINLNSFKGLNVLTELIITNNKINYIDDYSFLDLKLLNELNLNSYHSKTALKR
jgi:Leucine-rich repeat (LRR) protein